MDANTVTLFGGKEITLLFDDERKETLKIRQFKLREYPALLPQIDDEFALVALAIGKSRVFVEGLAPESFELAYATVREVNAKGFFTYAARQIEKSAANLRGLPTEMVEKLLNQKMTSLAVLPTVQPPRG